MRIGQSSTARAADFHTDWCQIEISGEEYRPKSHQEGLKPKLPTPPGHRPDSQRLGPDSPDTVYLTPPLGTA